MHISGQWLLKIVYDRYDITWLIFDIFEVFNILFNINKYLNYIK